MTPPDSMHFTIQAHDCGIVGFGDSHPGCVYISFTFTGDDGSVGNLDSVQIAVNLSTPSGEVQPKASNWATYQSLGSGSSDGGGAQATPQANGAPSKYAVAPGAIASDAELDSDFGDQVIRLNYSLLACGADGYVLNVTLRAKDEAGNVTYSYQRATGANCPW